MIRCSTLFQCDEKNMGLYRMPQNWFTWIPTSEGYILQHCIDSSKLSEPTYHFVCKYFPFLGSVSVWREKYEIVQVASKLIHSSFNIWRLYSEHCIDSSNLQICFHFNFNMTKEKHRNCTGCLKIALIKLQHLRITSWTDSSNLPAYHFVCEYFPFLVSVFCVARKAQNCTGCFKIYSSFNTWRLRLSLYQIHQICYSQHAISFANLFDLYVTRKIWSYTACLKIDLLKLQHLKITNQWNVSEPTPRFVCKFIPFPVTNDFTIIYRLINEIIVQVGTNDVRNNESGD